MEYLYRYWYAFFWRICYVLTVTSYVGAYSTGATTESCISLGIDHTHEDGGVIASQTFESWYGIEFPDNDDRYQSTRTVRVVIEAIEGTTFTGFILQARSSSTMTPVGQWTAIPANTRVISCGSGNDTVTHSSSGVAMRRLELGWTPSLGYGQVEFWASVSANYFVFWNNLRSRALNHVIPSTVSLRSNATNYQEDDGRFSIFICAEPTPSSDINVALEVIPLSSVDSGLSVPESVVIPAGTDCVERNVTLEDDLIPEEDGSYLISFTFVDAPYQSGEAFFVTIVDNDVIPSTVSLRSNATNYQEDDGQFLIFVCAEPTPSSDVNVALEVTPLSSVDNGLSVPDNVVILAGTDCVERNVTLEDDLTPEEDGSYLISFTSVDAPYQPGEAFFVTIVDNDVIPSTVSLRSNATNYREDDGQFPIFICAEPTPSSDINVAFEVIPLSGIDSGLSVPDSVVIPAGTDCIERNVTLEDDLTPEEDGSYLISFTSVDAPHQSGEAFFVTIVDNDEIFLPVSLTPRTLTLTEGGDGGITVCYNGVSNVSIVSMSVNLDTASSQDFQLSNLTVRITDTEPCATVTITAVEDNIVEEIEEFSLGVIAVSTNSSLRLDEREVTTLVKIMDIVVFPCDSNPCQNRGQCTNVEDDSFECMCTAEWSGPTCNRRIVIPCSSSPCSNGATCTDIGEFDFDCACPDGYVGRDCSLPNLCLFNQEICNNAGDCSLNGDGTARCDCMEGFYGNNCEISEECLINPCHNDGTCIRTVGVSRRCECPPRFFGENCELNNLCYGRPCLNGGTCESLPNNYRCICPTGITGNVCDTLIPVPRPCAVNPCRNRGTCDAVDGMAECRCPAGWDGPTCEQRVPLEVDCPPEMAGYCQNGARCMSSTIDPSSLRCVCPPQYTGTMCEIRLMQVTTVEPNNPCEPNPCRNNGRCFPVSQKIFTCTCALDFLTGEICDVCVTNHCFNGGTCMNANGERGCECPAGVTGNQCERVEVCNDFECNNSGFCIVADGRPVCQCSDGFTGSRCDETDPCSGISCSNGGICVDGACLCTGSFGGDFCENESGARSAASSEFLGSYLFITATSLMVVFYSLMQSL